MNMTNLGLPSSSILGIAGIGRWNWRACIPFFPFASTTINLFPWFCCCFLWICDEQNECLIKLESSIVLRFLELMEVCGTSACAFRDIHTSIVVVRVIFFSVIQNYVNLLKKHNEYIVTLSTKHVEEARPQVGWLGKKKKKKKAKINLFFSSNLAT